ncbi:MAG: ribosome biogenesis GTP-binding protein YihA/YsxC [Thiohalorhabdus sp.]|uniref:ribosome biogenesis GTP-binding protein YihA/YsxC n=1 Tax=Thiohalorhabdus sp. TaxID=3094134 RepID=UPI00397FDF2D
MDVTLPAAHFLIAAARVSDFPPDVGREVALAGHSNVGKSSALNAILQRKKLARTSSTPGRTQQLIFYGLGGEERRLVDLPGYGYAKVPPQVKAQWGRLMEEYLHERRSLAGLVLIMDIRRPMRDFDKQLLEWADFYDLPLHVLLTKADKAKKNEARRTLDFLRSDLASRFPEVGVQLFSALKRTGVEEARERLGAWLGLGSDE